MNDLRKLSIRDVGVALRRRQGGLAPQISHNLCRNAIGSARANFATHASAQTKRAARGAA